MRTASVYKDILESVTDFKLTLHNLINRGSVSVIFSCNKTQVLLSTIHLIVKHYLSLKHFRSSRVT